MSFGVYLTDDASLDLEKLFDYIEAHDSFENADYVLTNIEGLLATLSHYPERGSYPKELLSVGIRDYREVYFKPYRIIYRIIAQTVYVILIADGRRDMQKLLQQRLLQVRFE